MLWRIPDGRNAKKTCCGGFRTDEMRKTGCRGFRTGAMPSGMNAEYTRMADLSPSLKCTRRVAGLLPPEEKHGRSYSKRHLTIVSVRSDRLSNLFRDIPLTSADEMKPFRRNNRTRNSLGPGCIAYISIGRSCTIVLLILQGRNLNSQFC